MDGWSIFVGKFTIPIFTNIYPKNHPNVGKYTIHGAYGIGMFPAKKKNGLWWWGDLIKMQRLISRGFMDFGLPWGRGQTGIHYAKLKPHSNFPFSSIYIYIWWLQCIFLKDWDQCTLFLLGMLTGIIRVISWWGTGMIWLIVLVWGRWLSLSLPIQPGYGQENRMVGLKQKSCGSWVSRLSSMEVWFADSAGKYLADQGSWIQGRECPDLALAEPEEIERYPLHSPSKKSQSFSMKIMQNSKSGRLEWRTWFITPKFR